MADDSLEIRKDEVPFHPSLTPRGMTWFDLNVLTAVQQKLLNELKTDTIRENNQYLAKHPEVRALIILFLRAVLKEKPKLKSVADFAKDFFSGRPLNFIQVDVDEYLKARGEPLKKEGNSAVYLQFDSPKRDSSLGDMISLYQKDYYSWTTFTDEPSIAEAAPEWGSYDDLRYKDFPSSSATYMSSVVSGSDTTDRREFELLFASRASPYPGESLEASTLDLTKEYIEIFGGAPPDFKHPPTPLEYQKEDEEELEDEAFYIDDDRKILEEMKIAEQIEGRLSIIIENIEEEEEDLEDVGYEEVENKRSIIEMDLESLKENQSQSASEDTYEDKYNTNPSSILETMLSYEIGTEG